MALPRRTGAHPIRAYTGSVSATRLLILGAVRIFQPVHGYFVRRELMTWRADEWAHLNPGSVYNALRSLARDGFLREDSDDNRTTYRLTADGETEFLHLLRRALWHIDPFGQDSLLAAISFMPALARDEVVAALEHRIAVIETGHRSLDYDIRALTQDGTKPPHVGELLRLSDAWQQGELEWTRGLLERIRGGEYVFTGEPWVAPDTAPYA